MLYIRQTDISQVTYGSFLKTGLNRRPMLRSNYLCPLQRLFLLCVKNNVVQDIFNTVDENKSKYTIEEYSDAENPGHSKT